MRTAAVLVLTFSAWLAVSLGLANTDLKLTGVGAPGCSGAGYTGPGDVVGSVTAWWGIRAYSSAKACGAIINVQRASDNATQDIKALGNGNLDTATAATFAGTDATCTGTISGTTLSVSSCASGTLHIYDTISGTGINPPAIISAIGTCASPPGTCTLNASQTVSVAETITAQVALRIHKLYDQSANTTACTTPCDAVQNTAANQIPLILNCLNNLPCLYGNGGGLFAGTSINTWPSQPVTVSAVLQRSGNNTSYGLILGTGTNNWFGFKNATNTVVISGGTELTATASDGSLHAMQGVFNGNGSSSAINLDGTTTTGAAGTNGFGSSVINVGEDLGGNEITGYWMELGFWPIAFSSTQLTNMCHNQRLYWSSGGSC